MSLKKINYLVGELVKHHAVKGSMKDREELERTTWAYNRDQLEVARDFLRLVLNNGYSPQEVYDQLDRTVTHMHEYIARETHLKERLQRAILKHGGPQAEALEKKLALKGGKLMICPYCDEGILEGGFTPSCEQRKTGRLSWVMCNSCEFWSELWYERDKGRYKQVIEGVR